MTTVIVCMFTLFWFTTAIVGDGEGDAEGDGNGDGVGLDEILVVLAVVVEVAWL